MQINEIFIFETEKLKQKSEKAMNDLQFIRFAGHNCLR